MSDQEVFQTILKHYKLKDDICGKEVSRPHLEIISRSYCRYWRKLPLYLDLEDAVVHDIDRMQVSEGDKRRGFVFGWKEEKGSGATYECLIRALLEIQCRQDAENICKLLQEPTPDGNGHVATDGAEFANEDASDGNGRVATDGAEFVKEEASESEEKSISSPPVHDTTPHVSITEVRQRPAKGSTNPASVSMASVNKHHKKNTCTLETLLKIGGVIVVIAIAAAGLLILMKSLNNPQTAADASKPEASNDLGEQESSHGTSTSCHEVRSLDDLYNYLHEIGKWDQLCSQLGVDEGTIAEIREDPQASRRLYNCLKAFVDYGEPHSCWEKVVFTVCGPGFGKKKLGKTIAAKERVAVPSQCL